jgi:hypothetical protein
MGKFTLLAALCVALFPFSSSYIVSEEHLKKLLSHFPDYLSVIGKNDQFIHAKDSFLDLMNKDKKSHPKKGSKLKKKEIKDGSIMELRSPEMKKARPVEVKKKNVEKFSNEELKIQGKDSRLRGKAPLARRDGRPAKSSGPTKDKKKIPSHVRDGKKNANRDTRSSSRNQRNRPTGSRKDQKKNNKDARQNKRAPSKGKNGRSSPDLLDDDFFNNDDLVDDDFFNNDDLSPSYYYYYYFFNRDDDYYNPSYYYYFFNRDDDYYNPSYYYYFINRDDDYYNPSYYYYFFNRDDDYYNPSYYYYFFNRDDDYYNPSYFYYFNRDDDYFYNYYYYNDMGWDDDFYWSGTDDSVDGYMYYQFFGEAQCGGTGTYSTGVQLGKCINYQNRFSFKVTADSGLRSIYLTLTQ